MPIANTGPITITDILTVKGYRQGPVPDYTLGLVGILTRTPATPVTFTSLFTTNTKISSGPDGTQPHSLSEWRNVGNEITANLTSPILSTSGNDVVVTWTNGDANAQSAVLLMSVQDRDFGDAIDLTVSDYTVFDFTNTAVNATTHTFANVITTFGNRSFRALAGHYYRNTSGGDAGRGFQLAYVLAPGAVYSATGATSGSHAYSTVLHAESVSGGAYTGFTTYAGSCAAGLGTAFTVYHDATPLAVGQFCYAAASGGTLVNFNITGSAEFQLADGVLVGSSITILDNGFTASGFVAC